MIYIPQSDKSTVKCPSQDEAVARQFHPRLEKQTLIEERISGHLRVVQPSSENKHWRAKREVSGLLRNKLLFRRDGPPTLHRKLTPGKKENFLWIFVEQLLFDIMRSFQCEPFLLSAKRCNAMVEQKTKVFIAPRNFPPPRQAQISHKISGILQYFSDIFAVFLKCLIQNILL